MSITAKRVLCADTSFNRAIRATGSFRRSTAVASRARSTTAASTAQVLDFAHANIVPLGFTTVGVFSTDTALYVGIITAGSPVGSTTIAISGSGSAPAVGFIPAARAVTIADAVSLPSTRVVGLAASAGTAVSRAGLPFTAAVTLAAAEFVDLTHADPVPLGFAAIGILAAYAVLDAGIVATWCAVVFAAVSGSGTRSTSATISTAEFFDFTHTDVVPRCLTAIVILGTNTALYVGVVASGSLLGLTAVPGSGAWSTAAVRLVPATGAVTVTNTVRSPAAGVVRHATGAAAGVAGAGVFASTTALATAKLFYFTHTDVVPVVLTAKRVLCAHAVLNGSVIAARTVVGLAAVAASGARSSPATISTAEFFDFTHAYVVPLGLTAKGILGTNTVLDAGVITACAFVSSATVAITRSRSTAAVFLIPAAGAVAIANTVAGPPARVIGHTASAGPGIARTLIAAAAVALAAAKLLDLVHAHPIPLCFAAKGVLRADAVLNRRIRTTRASIVLAAVTVAWPRSSAATIAAAKFLYLANTDIVPVILTAEGVLCADAVLER